MGLDTKLWMGCGLGVVLLLALAVGDTAWTPPELWASVTGVDAQGALILREIRLPRSLLALLIGASLAIAGAALQTYLRNPLAEPGVLGISAGSALGAVCVFYSGLASALALALPLGGFAGAVIVTLSLYLFAGRNPGSITLLLGGIALNGFCAALIALALNLAPNPYATYEIAFWLMGSLADRSLVHLSLAGPFLFVGIGILWSTRRALAVLVVGEDTAASLGVDLTRLKRQMIVGTALCVGPAVAISGMLGFVGLLVPHLLRPLVSANPRRLLPASALGGAALLLGLDVVSRVLPVDLQLGVITGLIGAPLFGVLAFAEARRWRC